MRRQPSTSATTPTGADARGLWRLARPAGTISGKASERLLEERTRNVRVVGCGTRVDDEQGVVAGVEIRQEQRVRRTPHRGPAQLLAARPNGPLPQHPTFLRVGVPDPGPHEGVRADALA